MTFGSLARRYSNPRRRNSGSLREKRLCMTQSDNSHGTECYGLRIVCLGIQQLRSPHTICKRAFHCI